MNMNLKVTIFINTRAVKQDSKQKNVGSNITNQLQTIHKYQIYLCIMKAVMKLAKIIPLLKRKKKKYF